MNSAIRDFFIYVNKENLVEVIIVCIIVSLVLSAIDVGFEIWRKTHE